MLGVVWDSVINYYPLKNLMMVHGWFIRWCVCLIGSIKVSLVMCLARLKAVSQPSQALPGWAKLGLGDGLAMALAWLRRGESQSRRLRPGPQQGHMILLNSLQA
jgi:hypothetical protein